MNLSSVTPYITVAGPVIGLGMGTLLDLVLKDEVKSRFAEIVFRLANIGTRPITLSFYGLVVITSVLFTLIIISVNGTLQTITENEQSILIALKSAGPLFLAIFLKILVWDYLMALKSFSILNSFRGAIPSNIKSQYQKGWLILSGKMIIICLDLYITALLTGWFMNWFETFQMNGITSMSSQTQSGVKSFRDFFDEINLMLGESIKRSFYILNGSLLFYLAQAISFLARGIFPHIDSKRIRANIFKIVGAILTAILAVVLVIFSFVK